jgi:uncharacterized membrane protein YfhO
VLLEDWRGEQIGAPQSSKPRSATIKEYQPDRIVVEVEEGDPGYLVLTDIWYPGWQCTVDGEPAALYRANYLFRATPVPEGRHQMVFTFLPLTYQRGKWVSLLGVLVVTLIGGAGLARCVWPATSHRKP